MPIYEFRCQSCGHEFERLQKISDPDPAHCPECGAEAVSRLISAAAFRLKGGGWYETDFKGSNRRNVIDGGTDAGGDKKAADKPETATKPDKPDKPAKPTAGDSKQKAGSAKSGDAAA